MLFFINCYTCKLKIKLFSIYVVRVFLHLIPIVKKRKKATFKIKCTNNFFSGIMTGCYVLHSCVSGKGSTAY